MSQSVPASVAAAAVTRLVRRRIFGLEPHQIARLLETRDAMLHGIREGVVAVDEQGRLALVNDEAIRLLGLSEDPTGRPASDVLDTGGLLALAQQQDDVADRLVLAGERLLVANRTTASVDGRRVGAVLTLRDRTELYAALRELDGQRSITDALRAQAHEFSNQIHVLTGLLELGRQDEAVRYISQAIGGGAVLGGGTLSTVQEPEVAALLVSKSALARERSISLHLDPSSQVQPGGGADIVTILGNLVDNALDAADTGGSVEVAVSADHDGVLIRVADDGPGVPPSQRSRVFEPGVSTKQHRGGPHGRGIGLARVARVVTRRAGEVRVSDRDGGGAVFEVWLPHPPATTARPTTTVAGASR